MKTMKKMLSFVLVLALLLSFAVPAMAADEDFTLSLDKTSYKVGDTIYVTVNLNKSYTMANLNMRVWYDPKVVTYDADNSKTGDALSNCMLKDLVDPVAGSYSGLAYYEDYGWKNVNISGVYLGYDSTFYGTLAVIAFTVIGEAENAPFTIEIREMSNMDYKDLDGDATVASTTYVATKAASTVEGYTVTASEDKTIAAGENATVTVTVGGDADTYNAYDLTLTYDTDKLTYVSGVAADEGATVSEKDGTIRVVGYGADKAIDTAAVTLTFSGKGVGDANVTISSAKVDISNKAIDSDAPDATILDDTTVITIQGYTVKLGEGLSGESTVAPGADYTFSATDWDNYNYAVSGTMGGEDAEIIDNGDGTYTVKNVTGNLDISATMTPKSYNVTINGEDTTGAATATYNTDYTFTVTEQGGFTYEVAVTVGGNTYTGYSKSEGTYTIPGTDITGDIVITVTKTAIPASEYKVTVEGSGAGDVIAAETAKAGEDFTFTLNKVTGYNYEISATMGGKDVELVDNNDGTYTIKEVSGEIVITVGKESDLTVDVVEYITLDQQAMYLVTVSGTIADGSVAKYDGMAMFWSEKYNAYAWLVISAEGLDAVKTEAAEKVTIAEGTAAGTVDYSGDVNGTDVVDVNDAQLTYDMYNAEYASFDDVSMLKFLNADVNGDKTVNVSDAAAIVSIILGS